MYFSTSEHEGPQIEVVQMFGIDTYFYSSLDIHPFLERQQKYDVTGEPFAPVIFSSVCGAALTFDSMLFPFRPSPPSLSSQECAPEGSQPARAVENANKKEQ